MVRFSGQKVEERMLHQLLRHWIKFTTWTGLLVLRRTSVLLQLASNGCLIRYISYLNTFKLCICYYSKVHFHSYTLSYTTFRLFSQTYLGIQGIIKICSYILTKREHYGFQYTTLLPLQFLYVVNKGILVFVYKESQIKELFFFQNTEQKLYSACKFHHSIYSRLGQCLVHLSVVISYSVTYLLLKSIFFLSLQGLMQHPTEIAQYFNDRGVSVIFLLRRNVLRRLVSILANVFDKDAKLLNGVHVSHVHSHEEVILHPKNLYFVRLLSATITKIWLEVVQFM